ncbi:AAA family ATPase [uncultured Nostoc sp.]|uniref:AAA family ATPase n=1 Tax=uncultured Nostoc sp. TaxID=340711 RepID=UPI0035CA0FC9
MYIKNLQIQNYGPIDNISLNFELDNNSYPIPPLIFLGKNGTGKTLILSFIVDGIIELKRSKYGKLQEVEENHFFKKGKKDYIKAYKDFSYVNIDFETHGKILSYTELVTNLSFSAFNSNYSAKVFLNFDVNENIFQEHGFYKKTSPINEVKETLENNIFLYFPPTRYENPAWLGKSANIDFQFSEKIVGVSDRNIVKNNVLKKIEAWILNLLLDQAIYEKRIQPRITPLGLVEQLWLGYSGKNTDILELINKLLTIIYKVKNKNIEHVRIGVSEKNQRNIAIIIKNENENEINISPSFSHLSSGEIMLLALFASILEEYDYINNTQAHDTSNISGIVLIDEIDLHLHIELQKEILPQLLKLFPKIQFIITTHSPFFILGLDAVYNNQVKLIDLPIGNEITITEFSEFQKAYDIFVEKNEQFKTLYKTLSQEILVLRKPRIITEGKTDWKHLKTALIKLQKQGKFKQLDVEFLEYENEIQMGDGELIKMCEQFAKTLHEKKVIFVFDRDSQDIIKKANGNNIFRDWGNNVFSFCIPVPSHRIKYSNISIEFYYKDDEIKTIDNLGKKLYFSNEIDIVTKQSATNKSVEKHINALNNPKLNEEYDKKIYDQDVDKIQNDTGNLVALSKSNFANNIYNDKDGFKEFEIIEFEKIFEIIEQILCS